MQGSQHLWFSRTCSADLKGQPYGCWPPDNCSPVWSKLHIQFVTRNYSVDQIEITEDSARKSLASIFILIPSCIHLGLLHFQFRISGRSWPYFVMYCLCSISLSLSNCFR